MRKNNLTHKAVLDRSAWQKNKKNSTQANEAIFLMKS
jgi:hypothetical protein